MTTPHQFTALALRLFALWLTLSGLQIGLLAYTLRGAGQHGGEMSYAMAGCYVLLAALLWKFPLFLARRLLPAPAEPAPPRADATDAAAVIFLAAGLLIIALKALTPVANYLSLVTMLVTSGQSATLRSASLHVDGVTGIVMLAIGMTLAMQCRALAQRVLGRR